LIFTVTAVPWRLFGASLPVRGAPRKCDEADYRSGQGCVLLRRSRSGQATAQRQVVMHAAGCGVLYDNLIVRARTIAAPVM
jgi:hypothetical protein